MSGVALFVSCRQQVREGRGGYVALCHAEGGLGSL